jgi:hypothetical protein
MTSTATKKSLYIDFYARVLMREKWNWKMELLKLIGLVLLGLYFTACAPSSGGGSSVDDSTLAPKLYAGTDRDLGPTLADGQCETLQEGTLPWRYMNSGHYVDDNFPTKIQLCRDYGVLYIKATSGRLVNQVGWDVSTTWPRTIDRIQSCPSNRATLSDAYCKIGSWLL